MPGLYIGLMSGTSLGIMIGPSIGGWLYQAGGVALPFECVAALSLLCAIGFALLKPMPRQAPPERQTLVSILRVPEVAACALAIVLVAASIAMLEPVLPLFFSRTLGFSPAQIGVVFGCAAATLTVMPFLYGPLTDRWGGRRLTLVGLLLASLWPSSSGRLRRVVR